MIIAAECYCYAQTDTNLIAAGDWSASVMLELPFATLAMMTRT